MGRGPPDGGKTGALRRGAAGAHGRRRLADAGLQVVPLGQQVQVAAVRFGSQARKAGLEQGFEVASVKVPTDRPTPHWFYLPGLLLIGIVWVVQGTRMRGRVQPA